MPKNTCKNCEQTIHVMAHRGTGFCSQMCEAKYRAEGLRGEHPRRVEQ